MKKTRKIGASDRIVMTLNLPAGLAVKLEEESRVLGHPFEEILKDKLRDALIKFETDVDLSLVQYAAHLAEHKKKFQQMQETLNTTYCGKISGIRVMFSLEARDLTQVLANITTNLAALCGRTPEELAQAYDDAMLAVDSCLGREMVHVTVTKQARMVARLLVGLGAIYDPNFH